MPFFVKDCVYFADISRKTVNFEHIKQLDLQTVLIVLGFKCFALKGLLHLNTLCCSAFITLNGIFKAKWKTINYSH